MDVKRCTKCGETKPLTAFSSDKRRNTQCKLCQNIANLKRYHDVKRVGGKNAIKRECHHCGKAFFITPGRARLGEGVYCSKKCSSVHQWGIYHDTGRIVNRKRSPRTEIICEYCKTPFHVKEARKDKAKFCSPECAGKYRSANILAEDNPHWRGGISFEKYCPKFNESLKEKIREKFGRKCYLCPKTEEENGRKLDVHHVDYNKGQGCGHSWNLMPLCIRCHLKTNGVRYYYFNLLSNYWAMNPEINFIGAVAR